MIQSHEGELTLGEALLHVCSIFVAKPFASRTIDSVNGRVMESNVCGLTCSQPFGTKEPKLRCLRRGGNCPRCRQHGQVATGRFPDSSALQQIGLSGCMRWAECVNAAASRVPSNHQSRNLGSAQTTGYSYPARYSFY
jgi:hypothetical protein